MIERRKTVDTRTDEIQAIMNKILQQITTVKSSTEKDLEYMKKTRYAKDRTGKRRLYYIVR